MHGLEMQLESHCDPIQAQGRDVFVNFLHSYCNDIILVCLVKN